MYRSEFEIDTEMMVFVATTSALAVGDTIVSELGELAIAVLVGGGAEEMLEIVRVIIADTQVVDVSFETTTLFSSQEETISPLLGTRQYTVCNSIVTTEAGGQRPIGPNETVCRDCIVSPKTFCEAARKSIEATRMVFASGGEILDGGKYKHLNACGRRANS